MHYSTRSCAKSGGEDVITKPDGSKLTLTKGHSLSQHDINQINMVYQCDMAPTPSPPPTTPGPGTTRPPVTTGPATTAPPNKQCCSKYEIKRLSGRVNLMDNGIYEYKVILLFKTFADHFVFRACSMTNRGTRIRKSGTADTRSCTSKQTVKGLTGELITSSAWIAWTLELRQKTTQPVQRMVLNGHCPLLSR